MLEDMEVSAWGLSRRASTDATEAAAAGARWIEQLRPDYLVTEKVLPKSRKGARTRELIAALTAAAEIADVIDIAVPLTRIHINKYEEAAALVADHPALAHLLPKARRLWEAVPKATVYFEALSLALIAFGNPKIARRPSS